MKSMLISTFIAILFLPFLLNGQPIIVVNNHDTGAGSLRAAIDSANASIGPDTITFRIPGQGETEAGFISLITPLPDITDADLFIQGAGNEYMTSYGVVARPDIMIIGGNDPQSTKHCLTVKANNVHLSYLQIWGFHGGGIRFEGVMEGRVSACNIGLQTDDGEDRSLQSEADGISISRSSNIFIGPSEVVPVPNIISGYFHGVEITDSSYSNILLGNYIGIIPDTIVTWDFGNERAGIMISSASQFNEVLGNRIGYNGTGINIEASSANNIIVDNSIGTDFDFFNDFGNLGAGIRLWDGSHNNQIIHNRIGFNQTFGILNEGNNTNQNGFSRNAISLNTSGGINNMSGGNLEIPPPMLQDLVNNSLSGTTGANQVVEIYYDEGAQGRIYVDSTVSDASGDFSLLLNDMPGDMNMTAITRDSAGNTSEFSDSLASTPQGDIILVTNTSDSGTGSLRAAMSMANTNLGPDTIRFQIPKSDIGFDITKGVWYIKPDSILPIITDDNLFIDGTSQSQFVADETNENGPEIVLSGENISGFGNGISVLGSGFEIYDITINQFKSNGLSINFSQGGIVSGCYLGTNYDGTAAAGNKEGLVLGNHTSGFFIGPSDYLPVGNVISGNTQQGIFLVDSSWYNTIVGNKIGTDREGSTTIGNAFRGIDMTRSADHNEIFDNCISGNGMGLHVYESNDNVIANNFIGTDESGSKDLGNLDAGIFLWNGSKKNKIINNRIGYNQTYGIYNQGQNTTQNVFSKNSFHSNTYGEVENVNGGNLEITPPNITSVTTSSILGQSTSGQVIEICFEEEKGAVFYHDSTRTDPAGNFTFALEGALPDQTIVYAMGRDTAGNTSEFSEPFNVTTTALFEAQKSLLLYQNAPNPARNQTFIEYMVHRPSTLRIYLLNSQGIIVGDIVKGKHLPGKYALQVDVRGLPAGLYYYVLIDNQGNSMAKKMVVESP